MYVRYGRRSPSRNATLGRARGRVAPVIAAECSAFYMHCSYSLKYAYIAVLDNISSNIIFLASDI